MSRTALLLSALFLATAAGRAGADQPAGDAKAGDAKAGDAKAGDAKAGDAKAGDAKAGDAKAGDARAAGEAAGPLFDRLAAARTAAERTAEIEAILALDPVPVEEIAALLRRTRASSDAERRAILAGRGFDVPDEKGRFRAPGRQTEKQETQNDELDWLAPLLDQPPSKALSDVLIDVVAIRALVASKRPAGAVAILEFAFEPDGVAYRDECGRWLRRMSPWSLPALIMGAESRKGKFKDPSLTRYAKYQLERLDREQPRKALDDAPTDALKVEILEAFAESGYREAVFVVLDTVDHVAPLVRSAARAAWMEYATGKPPRPAPKQKLQLPGGKLTDKEMPLWMDHRELADIAIRRRLEKLTGEAPPKKATLAEMSEQLFQYYDTRRQKRMDEELEAGLAEAASSPAAAAKRFDAILVQVPDYSRRSEMAPGYIAHGEALEAEKKWREAAAAFAKAHAVAGQGPLADRALAAHLRARGKGLEAEGKDGRAELARASQLDATLGNGGAGGGAGGARWMLWAGLGGAVAGLLVLVWGLTWRRRGQYR